MDRMENIQQMEEILNEGQLVLDALARAIEHPQDAESLQKALAHWTEFKPRFSRLEAYYCSSQWQQDYDDSGFFSSVMSCGVLSQDAVFDLLEEQDNLQKQLQELQLL